MSEVYYKIRYSNSKITILCLQDFDEQDYNQNYFLSKVRFPSEAKAKAFLASVPRDHLPTVIAEAIVEFLNIQYTNILDSVSIIESNPADGIDEKLDPDSKHYIFRGCLSKVAHEDRPLVVEAVKSGGYMMADGWTNYDPRIVFSVANLKRFTQLLQTKENR